MNFEKSYIETALHNGYAVGYPLSHLMSLENQKRKMLGGSGSTEKINTLEGLVVPGGLFMGNHIMTGGKAIHKEHPPQLLSEEMFNRLFDNVVVTSRKRTTKNIRVKLSGKTKSAKRRSTVV